MATIQGTRFTYGYDTTATTYDGINEGLDISEMLDILRVVDVPILSLIGRNSMTAEQVVHTWYEDEYRGMTTVTTGLNNTTDPVAVTLSTAAHTAFFRGCGGTGTPKDYTAATSTKPGDIVRIWDANGSEIAIVTEVTSSAVTVDRSQLGSTPVSHTTSCNITIIGTLQPQGLTAVGESRTTTKSSEYNYTQIFEDSFKATKTQRATKKWVGGDDKAREIGKIMDLMGVQFERTLLFGRRQKPAATVGAQQGPAGAMGGIISFLSTNVADKTGAALTQTMLEDVLQAQWEKGAKSTYGFVNATQKRRINTFMDGYRQVGYSDTKLGTAVDSYATDFGTVQFAIDRHMPTDAILLIDPTKIKFGPLQGRALTMSQRPVESQESELWQVSGEYTCEVRLEECHAYLYGLSTTAP